LGRIRWTTTTKKTTTDGSKKKSNQIGMGFGKFGEGDDQGGSGTKRDEQGEHKNWRPPGKRKKKKQE